MPGTENPRHNVHAGIVSRWRDSGYLERAVETAGGLDAFDAAVAAMLDVLSRFAAALGGTLKLIADFGDEQLKLA
jgi:hypothetical protein